MWSLASKSTQFMTLNMHSCHSVTPYRHFSPTEGKAGTEGQIMRKVLLFDMQQKFPSWITSSLFRRGCSDSYCISWGGSGGVFLTFLGDILQHTASIEGSLISDELKGIGKEAVVSLLCFFPRIWLEGFSKPIKATRKTTDVLVSIRTRHHQDTIQSVTTTLACSVCRIFVK